MRRIVLSWALVVAGAVLLALVWDALPAEIPVYRSLSGQPTAWAERGAWSVARLPAMGAGQLGAITGMAAASRAHPGWMEFWRGAALVGGWKTLCECGQLAASAIGSPGILDTTLFLAAVGPVLLFLGAAALAWRRGRLSGPAPRPTVAECAVIGASLALWLGFAALPQWMA